MTLSPPQLQQQFLSQTWAIGGSINGSIVVSADNLVGLGHEVEGDEMMTPPCVGPM